MAILDLDFTGKDYDSLVAKADAVAKELLPEWTARDDNDLNWVTMKVVAYLVSMGMFYIDLSVSEQDPYEVQIYRNALKLARRYGMPVKKHVGATTTLDVTVKEHVGTKIIPRGTKFTSGGRVYIALEDTAFPDGVNAQPINVQYGSWSRISLGSSSGESFQKFNIADASIQSDGVRLFVNEGLEFAEWEKQDTLLMSRYDDLHFRQVLEEDETYSLLFGDNSAGKVPTSGASLEIEIITLPATYEADSYGNLPAGNTFTCADADVESVIQSEEATGGSDRESILSIGRNLPQWLSTANRCVAPNDYRYLARRVPGVADATVSQDSVVVNLYVIPVGGGRASTALMDKVEEYLNARKMNQVTINVLVPTQVKINVVATLTVQANVSKNVVLGNVIDSATKYLDQSEDVGSLLTLMDLYARCKAVSGTKSLKVTGFYRDDEEASMGDIQLSPEEVAVPGMVNILLSGMTKVSASGVCKSTSEFNAAATVTSGSDTVLVSGNVLATSLLGAFINVQ